MLYTFWNKCLMQQQCNKFSWRSSFSVFVCLYFIPWLLLCNCIVLFILCMNCNSIEHQAGFVPYACAWTEARKWLLLTCCSMTAIWTKGSRELYWSVVYVTLRSSLNVFNMATPVRTTAVTFVLYLWSVFMLFSRASGESWAWRQGANETAN